MIQNFSSMLAVLLVALAGVTILIMLEMNSRMQSKEEEQKKSSCFFAHRGFGYLFLMLFAFVLVYMVIKAGGLQEDISANAMIYVILGLLLVPLLMIKVVIARRQAQISTKLILLGTAIFGLSFGLAGIGYILIVHPPDEPEEENIEVPKSGQTLMSRKCSKCHSLERVYQTYKDDLAWTETVSKMAEFDYPNITGSDARQIVDYLTWYRDKRQLTETGRSLVARKCGICHELARVFGADKSGEEWTGTVSRMTEIMGDPDFLSEQEKKDIVSFLSGRRQRNGTGAAGDGAEAAAALVSAKCSAGCHDLNRILRVKKNRTEWTATVGSMVEITGNPNYLTEQEKKEIIDFLSSRKQEDGEENTARPKSSDADHPLVSRKCGVCHDLERVYQVGKNEEEWAKTVSSMAERTGDPNYLSEQEKKDIVTIISSWEAQK